VLFEMWMDLAVTVTLLTYVGLLGGY